MLFADVSIVPHDGIQQSTVNLQKFLKYQFKPSGFSNLSLQGKLFLFYKHQIGENSLNISWKNCSKISCPQCIFFDKTRNQLFVASQNTGEVLCLDIDTQTVAKVGKSEKEPLKSLYPRGMCYDSKGNFYVASYGDRCLFKIASPCTKSPKITTINLSVPGTLQGTKPNPSQLAIDSHDNIFYVAAQNMQLMVYTAAGESKVVGGRSPPPEDLSTCYQNRYILIEKLSYPWGVAFHPTFSHILFLADFNSSIVVEVNLVSGTSKIVAGKSKRLNEGDEDGESDVEDNEESQGSYRDGEGKEALFDSIACITVQGDLLYIADRANYRIRTMNIHNYQVATLQLGQPIDENVFGVAADPIRNCLYVSATHIFKVV